MLHTPCGHRTTLHGWRLAGEPALTCHDPLAVSWVRNKPARAAAIWPPDRIRSHTVCPIPEGPMHPSIGCSRDPLPGSRVYARIPGLSRSRAHPVWVEAIPPYTGFGFERRGSKPGGSRTRQINFRSVSDSFVVRKQIRVNETDRLLIYSVGRI